MINVSDLKPGVTFQMDGNLFVVLFVKVCNLL